MDINIQPSDGNAFQIEIGYFDTVLEMKEKIQKVKGIPITKQTLVFNGNVLQDELNVHYSDILDQSYIQLIVAGELSQKKIQLLVKMQTSKLGLALEMDVKETIRTLKEKIQDIEGIPAKKLVIHANGIELHDSKSLQDCELSDNSEIDVSYRSSLTTTISGSSGDMGSGSRKLRIIVVTKCGTKRIPIHVNAWDIVGDVKNKLHKLNEKLQLDLPQEGYFFIYKQNVMDDDRSFRWHQVCQGDTIEIFNGRLSGGS
ncbi:ubiquitin domain-containing protein 7SL RNA2-like [Olea europaea var. sylvestris]|uniref:ubiquitin domain-containing protein 7SL RNA2-like n=1 Tax=Olea europaea var. sylvestris TaxID=158386 RepID=UPI000C1D21D7|nr:ubiquitin domain-containing protein 7SL RNA2-like [Olea europaea var. sylvestris]